MLIPRAKHLIKKEIRDNFATTESRLGTQTLDMRRENISNVDFTPDIKNCLQSNRQKQ